MHCPHCEYPDTKHVYVRHNYSTNITKRRRECLRCNQRFFTFETPQKPEKPMKDWKYK